MVQSERGLKTHIYVLRNLHSFTPYLRVVANTFVWPPPVEAVGERDATQFRRGQLLGRDTQLFAATRTQRVYNQQD